jgi:hypothetical protein
LAFAGCNKLISVIIGDGVTTIGNSAFGSCTSLKYVTIGSGITSLGENAFGSCKSLSQIYCKAITPPKLENWDTFHNISDEHTFYVPTESVWLYQTTKWKEYADDIVGYDF